MWRLLSTCPSTSIGTVGLGVARLNLNSNNKSLNSSIQLVNIKSTCALSSVELSHLVSRHALHCPLSLLRTSVCSISHNYFFLHYIFESDARPYLTTTSSTRRLDALLDMFTFGYHPTNWFLFPLSSPHPKNLCSRQSNKR